MPTRLFVFVQMEFPRAFGPPDGRYLIRGSAGVEPEHVVVISSDRSSRAEQASAATRLTVIDPVSLSAENQARAWLEDLERESERGVESIVVVVNRVLFLHRIAAADPHVHEVTAAAASTIRAGWGEGEQVASGRWLHASELTLSAALRRPRFLPGRTRRERSAALAEAESLAALLGARAAPLLCEEFALRARLDLDEGRPAHAALELESALALAIRELRGEGRHDLALRVDELSQLSSGVAGAARAARAGEGSEPDGDVLSHALGRLEAALRARRAAGV